MGASAKLWITGCLCCVESDVAAHWETGIQHSRLPGGLCSVFHAARQGSGLLEQVQVVIQAALILTYFYPDIWMTEVGIPFKNIIWLSSLVAIARSIAHCGASLTHIMCSYQWKFVLVSCLQAKKVYSTFEAWRWSVHLLRA